ncbi:hypothetical protein UF75_1515 [Desulfosporosinus sp. I2]|nr:hypothetical protein UF75_1515 [Desulfosporosinus sp. I2]
MAWTQYRAIYEIVENKITVLVLFIDKREGFYETLKRMKMAKRLLGNSMNYWAIYIFTEH